MATFDVLVTPFDWVLDGKPSQWVPSEENETFDELVGRLEYDVLRQDPPPHAAYLVTSRDGNQTSLIITNAQLLALVGSRMCDDEEDVEEEDDDEGGDEGEGEGTEDTPEGTPEAPLPGLPRTP